MSRKTTAFALALALPLSSLLVACGGGEDTPDRAALQREALERDLSLALQPDTTPQIALADVPLPDTTPAAAAPAPAAPKPAAQAPAPAPAPRRAERAPAPAPSRPAEPRYVTRTVPGGSTFSVSINQTLSTRTSSVGETFTATLNEPLVDAQGRTVIPAGATVRGRIRESRAQGNVGQRPRLAVSFTSIRYGGETYPIDATVVSQPATYRDARSSRTATATKIGGGAVAGAVVGRVIGGRRSTVRGAVVGAAAGTAVAIGAGDVDHVIAAGSSATIQLDGPITVRKEAS